MNLSLDDFVGKWYIQYTNFPMWLKGDKLLPTFNYQMSDDKKGLYDEVQYQTSGQYQSIKGFDTPLNDANTAFCWRGKGFLYFFQSKWKILYIDPQKQWAIIFFEKTWLTPKGYDVITRSETINNEIKKNISLQLNNLNIPSLQYIRPLPQTP